MEGEGSSRTQVGIVGAGPAGLVLSHLLAREGIECVVLEDRSREYVEKRVRAGVLEQGTVDLLTELGLAERLHREGLVHQGIELRFDGARPPDPVRGAGRGTGHHDLRPAGGGQGPDRSAARRGRPAAVRGRRRHAARASTRAIRAIRFTHNGGAARAPVRRRSPAATAFTASSPRRSRRSADRFERDYPFAWLGILAQVAPSTEELIYAPHERGFALHSLRSPELSRLYVQCDPDDGSRTGRTSGSGRSCDRGSPATTAGR